MTSDTDAREDDDAGVNRGVGLGETIEEYLSSTCERCGLELTEHGEYGCADAIEMEAVRTTRQQVVSEVGADV